MWTRRIPVDTHVPMGSEVGRFHGRGFEANPTKYLRRYYVVHRSV